MISINCHFCDKPVGTGDIVRYSDHVYFYWCSCSVGTILYRSNQHEKKASKPVSGKRRKTPSVKGSRANSKGKSKVQPRNGVKPKGTSATGRPKKKVVLRKNGRSKGSNK